MYNSQEYKLFCLDKYNIIDENNKLVNTYDGCKDRDKIIDNPIKLKILIEKLNSFNIKFEQLEGFYTKITNKTNFYKTNILNFNSQQINLEGRKDIFTKKVKEILSNNYKNFEDLVKTNSRFNKFVETYSKEFRKKYVMSRIEIDFPQYYSEFYNRGYGIISSIKSILDFMNTM